jgi:regulator of nonsense transcripts 2
LEEVRKLEEELSKLELDGSAANSSPDKYTDDGALTPKALATPRASSPPHSPNLAPQGPSQLLTALLAKLPDAVSRTLIDQAAVEFAFLNSKAARKRLVKVCC